MGCFRQLDKYERAALIVRNALHGRRPAVPTDTSIIASRIYHSAAYRTFYVLVVVAQLCLAYVEQPSPVNLTPAQLAGVRAADFFGLFVVAADLVLQLFHHGLAVWATRGWVRLKGAVLIAIFINLCASIALPGVSYALRCLRPIFLIERLRNVRQVAINIASAAPRILNVLVLVAIHLMIFSVLGFVLFAGVDDINCTPFRAANPRFCSTFGDIDDCSDFFNSLEGTMIQLFELLTAANFPAIAIPVYRCDPTSSLYFAAFLVIGVYLILSLTLAVAANTFQSLMADETIAKFGRAFAGYDMAWEELASIVQAPKQDNSDVSGAAPSLAAVRSRQQLLIGRDDFVKFLHVLRPAIEADAAARMFTVFDPSGRGGLDQLAFRQFLLHFGAVTIRRRRRRQAGSGPARQGVTSMFRSSSSNSSSGGAGGPAQSQSADGSTVIKDDGAAAQVSADAADAVSLADLSDDEDEGEIEIESLDMDEAAAAANSPNDGGASISSENINVAAGGGTVVPNPLAAVGSPFQDRSQRATLQQLGSPLPPPPPPMPGSPAALESQRVALVPEVVSHGNSDTSAAAEWADRPARRRRGCCSGGGGGCLSTLTSSCSLITTSDGYPGDPQGPRGHLLPRGVTPNSTRGRLIAFMRKTAVMLVFDAAIVVNTAAVLVQVSVENDEEESTRNPTVVAMERLELGMLAIFLLEITAKVALWGPSLYWRESRFHRLDAALIVLAIVGTALDYTNAVSDQVSAATSFVRFLRLLRVLRVVPGFGLTMGAFSDILPVLLQYGLCVVASFYFFSLVGMAAFGGKLTPDNPAVAASSYGVSDYYLLNYDSLAQAGMSLLFLLALNDWPILMDAAVAATGKGAIVYFVVFWLVNIVLILNVIIAFLIESFTAQKTKRELLARKESQLAARAAAKGFPSTSTPPVRLQMSPQAPQVSPQPGSPHRTEGDWRDIILRSRVDFSGYHLSRTAQAFDVYAELYKDQLAAAYPDTFARWW